MIGILATIPLIISIVSFIWSRIMNDTEQIAIGKKTHIILILSQLTVVTFFFISFSVLSKSLIISLYVIQAIGVSYLLFKKGDVPCGCFGPQFNTKLQPKLIMYNIFLALFTIISFYENLFFEFYQGLILEFLLSILLLVCIVGIPDAWYAIKGYKKVANRYREHLNKY